MHKVILADDHSVFRTGMARILAVEDDFRIIGQCDDLPRLMKAVSGSTQAIALFSASLHPELTVLNRSANEAGTRLIAILDNSARPQEYLAEGIKGILYRDIPNAELLRAVRCVGRGESYTQQRTDDTPGRVESDLVAERVRERLTPKELQIVGLILRGYKNKDIAEELHNSEQVIKNYLRSIFDKTGVADRLELALFVIHHKILADAAMGARGLNAPAAKPMTLLRAG